MLPRSLTACLALALLLPPLAAGGASPRLPKDAMRAGVPALLDKDTAKQWLAWEGAAVLGFFHPTQKGMGLKALAADYKGKIPLGGVRHGDAEVQKAIDALAGVPSGGAALSFGAPSDAIKDARSTIEYSVIVSAELSGIFPGDRQRMRADVAALVGVPTEQVIATFLNATSSRAARRLLEDTLASPVWQRVGSLASFASASASAVGREPSAAAHARRRLSASVRVSFVIFVKDEAAAAAVAATLSSELGGADAASSFLALTVTSLPTVTTTSTASSLASMDFILAGGGLAACVVLLCCCCVALTVTARRRRRKTAEAYAGKGKCGKCTGGCGRGCRRNGCLSFHALKASIGCELVAVLFALGALALLYLKASTLKPALGVIIDELANLKNSTGHGREAYDNLGKELDLLQVTSA